ncbi:MAG: hypothetical protein Q4G45_08235 [Actinomycetia bacterium]|nr:hypothetical protein [Actinomycetes bacterium]
MTACRASALLPPIVALALLTSGCDLLGGRGGAAPAPSTPAATSTTASSSPSPSVEESPSASPSTAATTARPAGAVITSEDTLTTTGIGGIKIGSSAKDLASAGYTFQFPQQGRPNEKSWCGTGWEATKKLQTLGINLHIKDGQIIGIYLRDAQHATKSGARVGMTIEQVKKLYGDRVREETKGTQGGPSRVLVMPDGNHEIVFAPENDLTTTLSSSEKVKWILSHQTSPTLGEEYC